MKAGMTVLAGVAAMIVAASASATISGISLGTAAPPKILGGATMTPFPLDPQPGGGAPVSSVASPLGGTVGFPAGFTHSRIGAGWATWSHGYTGDVYFNGGAASSTITMPVGPGGPGAFYFYVEGNGFAPANFTIQATNSAAESTTVTLLAVLGASGATGVGFTSSSAITSITIINTDGLAGGFAIGEFGIPGVPGPGALGLLGVAGMIRRRRRA